MHSREKTRRRRDEPKYFYEVTWTNKTLLPGMDKSDPRPGCPSEAITDSVVRRIFGPNEQIAVLSNKFDPDFRLLHVGFRPIGRCIGYLSPVDLGEPPTPHVPPPTVRTSTAHPGVSPTDNKNDIEEAEREYYVSSILPALITIGVMLVVALIIVIVLVKYRRNQVTTTIKLMTLHNIIS